MCELEGRSIMNANELGRIKARWAEEPDDALLRTVTYALHDYSVEVQEIICAEACRRNLVSFNQESGIVIEPKGKEIKDLIFKEEKEKHNKQIRYRRIANKPLFIIAAGILIPVLFFLTIFALGLSPNPKLVKAVITGSVFGIGYAIVELLAEKSGEE
jgi:hypothetical protein